MRAEITRTIKSDKETLGEWKSIDGDKVVFTCKTLELPWNDNKNNISCIPTGTYTVVKRKGFATRPYDHFHVTDVPYRNWILIHIANYVSQILGCIIVGSEHKDINKDGLLDITDSAKTLKALYDIMPDKFELTIK